VTKFREYFVLVYETADSQSYDNNNWIEFALGQVARHDNKVLSWNKALVQSLSPETSFVKWYLKH